MIQARKSDEYLSKENILRKVSEYQIFRYFCRNFKELNTKFRSDLREDNSPTVSIALIGQRLYYKDFGYPDHSFDCFGYIKQKYNLDFYGALIHIDGCFGLGLATGIRIRGLVPQMAEPILREKKRSEIQVRVRDWDSRDAAYWRQFGISKKLLRIFDVQPITHYWINEQRFSCDSISYRYRFDCGYKIYRPLERDFKWSSNVGMECLQGYEQLPSRGRLWFSQARSRISCAWRCLTTLHCSTIRDAGANTIEEAQASFEELIVLYDIDFDNPRNPGQTMAVKICEKYGLDNIVIPSYYRSKDISDLIKDHGLQEAKHVITRKENRRSYIKKEST